MAYLAVNDDGKELLFISKPFRTSFGVWAGVLFPENKISSIELPMGSIEEITGYKLKFDDDPIEI